MEAEVNKMSPGVTHRTVIHCWFHTELLFVLPKYCFYLGTGDSKTESIQRAKWGCPFTKLSPHLLLPGTSSELSSLPMTHDLNRSYCLCHLVMYTKGFMGKWMSIHPYGSLV
jgi:hypothetical protein